MAVPLSALRKTRKSVDDVSIGTDVTLEGGPKLLKIHLYVQAMTTRNDARGKRSFSLYGAILPITASQRYL
jgi:hypothetical protein